MTSNKNILTLILLILSALLLYGMHRMIYRAIVCAAAEAARKAACGESEYAFAGEKKHKLKKKNNGPQTVNWP
jgi:hypothetical protein